MTDEIKTQSSPTERELEVWKELYDFASDCINWGDSSIQFKKFIEGRNEFEVKIKSDD